MKTLPSISPRQRGFTLTELLVATGLASVVLATFVGGFLQSRRTFHQKNLEQEMQQNVRTAMMFLQRDLRYAGSGLVMGTLNLDDWFGLPSEVNVIPWITDGGDASDEMIVIGISGEAVAELTEMALEGSSTLRLAIRDPAILPYLPKVGDVLLLAGIEAVVVNQVHDNNVLTVSRDPTIQNVGLHLIYPAGTEVFQLNVIRYRVSPVEGVPSLLREDARYTYGSDEDRVVADGIEHFNVTRTGDLVQLELRGRSRRTAPGAPSPDSLLRYTMTSSNRIRNPNPRLSIQGWPSDILVADSSTPADPGDSTPDDPPPADEDTGGEDTGGEDTGGDDVPWTGPPGQDPNRKVGGGKK